MGPGIAHELPDHGGRHEGVWKMRWLLVLVSVLLSVPSLAGNPKRCRPGVPGLENLPKVEDPRSPRDVISGRESTHEEILKAANDLAPAAKGCEDCLDDIFHAARRLADGVHYPSLGDKPADKTDEAWKKVRDEDARKRLEALEALASLLDSPAGEALATGDSYNEARQYVRDGIRRLLEDAVRPSATPDERLAALANTAKALRGKAGKVIPREEYDELVRYMRDGIRHLLEDAVRPGATPEERIAALQNTAQALKGDAGRLLSREDREEFQGYIRDALRHILEPAHRPGSKTAERLEALDNFAKAMDTDAARLIPPGDVADLQRDANAAIRQMGAKAARPFGKPAERLQAMNDLAKAMASDVMGYLPPDAYDEIQNMMDEGVKRLAHDPSGGPQHPTQQASQDALDAALDGPAGRYISRDAYDDVQARMGQDQRR
jgi:hypothetical protein